MGLSSNEDANEKNLQISSRSDDATKMIAKGFSFQTSCKSRRIHKYKQ